MLQSLASFLTLAQEADFGRGAAGAGAGLFMCVLALIGLAVFAFWLWMLIDAIQRDFKDSTEKIIWILVIVLTGIIGALIYYFIGRSRGTKA